MILNIMHPCLNAQVDAAVTEHQLCAEWSVTGMASQMPDRGAITKSAAAAESAPLRAVSGAETDATAARATGSNRREDRWDTEDDWDDTKGSSWAGGAVGRVGGGDAGSVRLVVGVLTRGRNRARRDAVRQTWGADPRWVPHNGWRRTPVLATTTRAERRGACEPMLVQPRVDAVHRLFARAVSQGRSSPCLVIAPQ